MNCILTIKFIEFMNSKKVNDAADYERSLEARHRMLALKNYISNKYFTFLTVVKSVLTSVKNVLTTVNTVLANVKHIFNTVKYV